MSLPKQQLTTEETITILTDRQRNLFRSLPDTRGLIENLQANFETLLQQQDQLNKRKDEEVRVLHAELEKQKARVKELESKLPPEEKKS